MAVMAWLIGTKLGRGVLIGVAAIAAILGLRWKWMAEGARAAAARQREKANELADERRRRRAQIDRDVRDGGAAERLRNNWSRD